MPSLPNTDKGFTLIELMIVVAIIGILAAIAVPNFIRFQLRSKHGEAKLNLATIRTAEVSYFGEYGTYIDMVPEPQATPHTLDGYGSEPPDPTPADQGQTHNYRGPIEEGTVYLYPDTKNGDSATPEPQPAADIDDAIPIPADEQPALPPEPEDVPDVLEDGIEEV